MTDERRNARRRLDLEVVRRGLAESRTRAAALISAGRVLVDGRPERRPGAETGSGHVTLRADPSAGDRSGPLEEPFASRAGAKLSGALDAWPDVPVAGARCLDAGASTGGFTDVLLRRGAAHVAAVDVGHGQLRPHLRADPRVTVLEGHNVRELSAGDIGGHVGLTVADLSFISLTLVLRALIECTTPTGELVVLVKPQFEVGRERLGRGGVVREPELRLVAVRAVAQRAGVLGRPAAAAVASSLPGPAGNVEYFLRLRAGATPLSAEVISGVVLDP
ncbi:MAG: TlyA family RNA methyltransferase [bacterium]